MKDETGTAFPTPENDASVQNAETTVPASMPAQVKPPAPASELSPLQQKKNADAAYNNAVNSAAALLQSVQAGGSISRDGIHGLAEQISRLFSQHNSSLMLENLLMARINQQYYPHHAVNVALLNAMISTALSLTPEQLSRMIRLGMVIDLGMLQLPTVLTETNRVFTDAERASIRQHPIGTVELLKASGEADALLLNGVLLHHERMNGSGYPQHLQGDDIPLEARITAVSDTFDAATSRKAYRNQKSPFQMLAEFSENPGGALDPQITTTAVRYLASLLVGRNVVLADNSVGRIVDVDPDNLAYPLVRVVGRLIQTGPELPTVMLSGFIPLHRS